MRDEGEDYGRKLREAGCRVRVERIEGALHGYFALGIQQFYVQESFRHINRFLSVEQALFIEERGGSSSEGKKKEPVEKTG